MAILVAWLAGLVIAFTGGTSVDPLLSLAIGALILVSSLALLREALHGLMEGHHSMSTRKQLAKRRPACPAWPRYTICTSGRSVGAPSPTSNSQ